MEMERTPLVVRIKKADESIPTPVQAKYGDAGFDLTAYKVEYDSEKDAWVYDTGIHFEIPYGYWGAVCPRSSIVKTNYFLANSPGVADAGYRGTIKLIYKSRNSASILKLVRTLAYSILTACKLDLKTNAKIKRYLEALSNKKPFELNERIGQIIIVPLPNVQLVVCDKLSESERGEGSYGHTGK